MVRKVLIATLLLSGSIATYGQYKFDYGVRLGASNYLGDIGGKEQTRRDFVWDMKLSQTRWVAGGFARYRFNQYFGVNAGLSYARIQGDDARTTNPARRARNLSFVNDMLELYARGEFYFYSNDDLGNRGRYYLGIKTYVFAGVGGLLHGPKTSLNGETFRLRPLATEGVNYSPVAFVVPMGMGVYLTKKRENRFGFEIVWNMAFTDYLDDISTVYVDPETLPSDISRELYNRNDELTAEQQVGLPNSQYYGFKEAGDLDPVKFNKRGDEGRNDNYLFASFTYSRVIPMYGPNTFYRQHVKTRSNRVAAKRKIRAKF
jgi:hypothetical protein